MQKHIVVDTYRYQASHGHKPRNIYGAWAFAIDVARGRESDAKAVLIAGTYKDALKAAKAQARFSVTVLP